MTYFILIFWILDLTMITDLGSQLSGAIKKELAAAKKKVSGGSCSWTLPHIYYSKWHVRSCNHCGLIII